MAVPTNLHLRLQPCGPTMLRLVTRFMFTGHLSRFSSLAISMRYDEKNLFPKYILEMEAKMKVTHAIASRGSRANTRAGASTRSKPSSSHEAGKGVHFNKPPRRKLSPQAETPTEDR